MPISETKLFHCLVTYQLLFSGLSISLSMSNAFSYHFAENLGRKRTEIWTMNYS